MCYVLEGVAGREGRDETVEAVLVEICAAVRFVEVAVAMEAVGAVREVEADDRAEVDRELEREPEGVLDACLERNTCHDTDFIYPLVYDDLVDVVYETVVDLVVDISDAETGSGEGCPLTAHAPCWVSDDEVPCRSGLETRLADIVEA